VKKFLCDNSEPVQTCNTRHLSVEERLPLEDMMGSVVIDCS
jgi:hypothetical protein